MMREIATKRWAAVLVLVCAVAARVSGQATVEKPAETTGYEAWDILFMQGSRVGHAQTIERPVTRDGVPMVEVIQLSKFSAKRFGEALEQTMKFESWETPEGELREFRAELQMGQAPAVMTGVVEGNKLRIETRSGDRTQVSEIDWKPSIRGFNALEQSIRRDPPEPGERREFEALMPVFNQVAKVTLEGGPREEVKLLDETRTLQRVDTKTSVGGLDIVSTLWIDEQGAPLKSDSPVMSQVAYRLTREEAEKPLDKPGGDLALTTLAAVKNMPKNFRSAERIAYRVSLEDTDPAKTFAALGWQQVEPGGPKTAVVTVEKCGPKRLPPAPAPESDRPTPDDLAPNSLIESDDPLIRSLAAEGIGGAETTLEKALALEEFVHDKIAKKDFSTVFASAAETAKSCEGDCTEHGVLLAALLRANKIPARTVVGLVYVRELKAFGYHMWTEAWIDDRWVPLDATLAYGGTDAGHIAITTSNLAGASPYSVFLPVANVLGRLKIEVVE